MIFNTGLGRAFMAVASIAGASAVQAENIAPAPADQTAPAVGAETVGECLFLVFSHPIPGREEEFENWYTGQHVADVVNAAGFDTGRRYRLAGEGPHRYLALYQVKCDDPAANAAALHKAMVSGNLKMSDSFDHASAKAMVFLVHSPLVKR